ncbi:MAG: sugar phosphate isomerase/epimerase [Acidobacteria bacterium]|nr:sugar phosphate isomerase/epimerase [Acidobacteriota bacterium]
MRFGVSTHLYQEDRLRREHLIEVAEHGFDSVELFATRAHFDYRDRSAVADLESWLREAGLSLHSIHAPVTDVIQNGRWGRVFSNAAPDSASRDQAVLETDAALAVARRIPTSILVLHLGVPDGLPEAATANHRDAARRSVEEIARMIVPLGMKMALEVIGNDLSTAASLVRMLEDEMDVAHAGICMDVGHAFLLGDVMDAIETASGHVMTTHIHDNLGKRDDHLAPFEGAIDWLGALTAFQKIGYEGLYLFEVGNTSTTRAVLSKAQAARDRFERVVDAQLSAFGMKAEE